MPDAYAPTDRSRVKRMHERGKYDQKTVFEVVDAGFLCHVGYVIDGQPYVTPTFHWREGERVYWHGSSASRMIRQTGTGIPVCLTVTHFDGLVMARSGMHHSVNYRAAMLFGTASVVDDSDHKMAALKAFMDRVADGRWEDVRPPNQQEFKATTVISMEIEEASAKIRTGGPVDDEEDYALPCWAGVVPIHTILGEPIADDRLPDGVSVPSYLGDIKLS